MRKAYLTIKYRNILENDNDKDVSKKLGDLLKFYELFGGFDTIIGGIVLNNTFYSNKEAFEAVNLLDISKGRKNGSRKKTKAIIKVKNGKILTS